MSLGLKALTKRVRISEAIGTSFILAAVMPHLTRISSSLLLSMNFAVFLTVVVLFQRVCVAGFPESRF